MDDLRRVAVVTGASQGIGASLVAGFRASGMRVVANARGISPTGDPNLLAVPGDIADPVVAQRIVDAAIERFGRIDTLVNNAGVFISKPFEAYTAADFAAVVAVNLSGFFHLSQLAASRMLKAGCGHIVNITATIASQPMAAVPAALTALTKGGLNAVTRALAIEYAGRGIRVNAVSPGIVCTPMHKPEAQAFLSSLQPVGRMGTVEDVVAAVLYLDGAPFVTGEILHVDGGANAGHW